MKLPFLRTPYNYDRDLASDQSGLKCEDPSLAQQHQKHDADINNIVARFGLTGELPNFNVEPRYGDFSHAVDYHTAMNSVIAAQSDFMKLPANLRSRFQNDPAALIDFLADDTNRSEAESLGLVPPKVVAQAAETPTEGGGSTVST